MSDPPKMDDPPPICLLRRDDDPAAITMIALKTRAVVEGAARIQMTFVAEMPRYDTPERRLYLGEPDVHAAQPDRANHPEQWRVWYDTRVRCARRLPQGGRCYQARAAHSTRCDWCQGKPDES